MVDIEYKELLAMLILGIFGGILLYQGNADITQIAGWILVFVSPSPVLAVANIINKK